MTDEQAFEVGRNLAISNGAVVFENELFQLIQYQPTTETVGKRPLVLFPPSINKFYVLDLQPANSFVRYAVEQGNTVLMVSFMDGMTDRGWGRVINVSSVNGSKGAFGQTNYSAAKSGMHGFTKALALGVARKGVTINTISPGYIGTKMVTAIPKEVLDSKILPQIPLGRLGLPEEIAGLIIYLCSDEAAFVTGTNIAINGGQHMQ
jgi:NAD(P)-dependent dehydrogenase (short-subunit alcohol dehydrogenase family)